MRVVKMLVVVSALIVGIDGLSTVTFPKCPFGTKEAEASVRWVNSSRCSNGGYYRDTSNDGNPYNNANYLGYN